MEERSKQFYLEPIDCQIERYEATVSVKEFFQGGIDVDRFLECCRQCPNYGKIWSCPPYDFDVAAYWKKYQSLRIIGMKVFVPSKLQEQTWTPEEVEELNRKMFLPIKKDLTKKMYDLEQSVP